MKNTSIPLIATLCCTLTACTGDKEPNEEDDTVTEPSFEEEEEVVVGDISAIIGPGMSIPSRKLPMVNL